MRGPACSHKPQSVMRPARIPDAKRRPLQVLTLGAVIVCLGVSLALGALGCQSRRHAVSRGAPHPRQELIAAIKDFEKQLGFQETNNFSRHSDKAAAGYRCYYTGKLELPETYEGLRVKGGSRDGCRVDESKYDVFFYAMEAVASGNTSVTGSLSQASPERLMVVVPHEDFHNDKQVRKLPAAMSEAASTLAGFLTASQFSRYKFGANSPEHKKLAQEADLFLRKAELVNAYYSEISALYDAHRSKQITKLEALAKKEKLFSQLEKKCRAILPKPVSFNPCPAAGNNAGLAFDRTYTQRYPLLYGAFKAQPRGLAETIQRLRELANSKQLKQAKPDLIEEIVAATLTGK